MRRILSWIATFIVSVYTVTIVQPAMAADTTSNTAKTDIHPPHAFVLPCSVVLNPVKDIPNARGTVVFFDVREKYAETIDRYWQKTAISVMANHLPAPSSFGDYDTYEGFAQVPGLISWRVGLVPSRYLPPQVKVNEVQVPPKDFTWAGTYVGITEGLTKETKVQVRLANSKTDKLGPAVLEGTVKFCH